MWVSKREMMRLSREIRRAIDGQAVELRDNREGALSILKNDINTLVTLKNDQREAAQRERDALARSLADISHQLKTPITSMMIMADLLEGAPADKQAEFVSNLKISLTRMEWLVAALLKIARLDSGTVEFTPTEIQTRALLDAALQPLAILLDVNSQSVALVNDIPLVCDKRWTAEALTNLLKNAAEHSPPGSRITVDCGENPIYKWITVTDCGEGISRERCAGLFRRFAQSSGEKGYGIGLPLALAIARGQNGELEVDGSGRGKGATFTLKFFK